MDKVRFEAHRAGGALVVQVSGLFTRRAAHDLCGLLSEELGRAAAVKALIDLRLAAILTTAADLSAVMTRSGSEWPSVGVATGILVDPAYEKLCWQHCLTMMQRGHTRMPFIHLQDALRWLGVAVPALQPTRTFLPVS